MKCNLLASVLLPAAACGDNLHDTDNQTSAGTEDGATPNDGGDEARPFEASPLIYFPSCDANVVSFEADGRYTDTNDLEFVPNISCLWKFDDGATSTSCAGEHTFAEAGWHDFIVEVTDLDTGVTVEAAQRRYMDPVIEANLDVTTGDRTITWNATVNVGSEVHVFVEPGDLLVNPDPLYHTNRNYTVEVARDGVYTVRMTVEDERGSGPICSAEVVKQVNVFCTGGEHTHEH